MEVKRIKFINFYKCNHNPLSENSTLIESPKRNMVFPEERNYMCKNCQKIFKFIKDGEILSLVKGIKR